MMKKTIKNLVLLLVSFTIGCSPAGENFTRQPKLEKAFVDTTPVPILTAAEIKRLCSVDPGAASFLFSYGATIKKYSKEYGLDWRLVLAVTKQESGFSHKAVSHMGAAGLMQVMPATEAEIAVHLNLQDLAHPQSNIQGGIFYLRKLYNLFRDVEGNDRIKLTLAAYNAGLGRVQDAQELAAYYEGDPKKWESVSQALAMLSSESAPLHENVFEHSKPNSGYFNNSGETLAYVEKIMGYYDDYRTMLN